MKKAHLIPELQEIEALSREHQSIIVTEKIAEVEGHDRKFPLYGLKMGTNDPEAPTFALFGGVHGIERIGSHVLLAFLKTLLQRTRWEKDWQRFFAECRLITIPVINPMGMALTRRSNGNGVDLMRNAPLDADGKMIPLVSGHRIGPYLPWYRGPALGNLEVESKAVMNFCREHFFKSSQVISLDLHSGFGFRDRLWYPWATSRHPFPHEPHVKRLKKLFEQTHPFHVYIIEHQSLNYSNHGDLWDWVYQLYLEERPIGQYLPLTLEMGSWMWVKKNIWQFFSWEGLFNPIKKHRYARTMRRHQQLLEFLLKATLYNDYWSNK